MNKKLVLASGSPRRKELLNLIGLKFELDVSKVFKEKNGNKNANPAKIVAFNAKGKAKEVASRHKNAIILGVDTVVAIKGHILGKPVNQSEAIKMLKLLQGKTHQVWTGVYMLDLKSQKSISFQDKTDVTFLKMTDKEIRAYIKTKEPMDKAGAYAIQGLGSKYIKEIHGDFFSVMGLPVWRVNKAWKTLTSTPD